MIPRQSEDLKQQAQQAFDRDLPRLWQERPGQWVAYQGDRLLDFGMKKHELYQECFSRGLQRDEFVIFCIESQETEAAAHLLVDHRPDHRGGAIARRPAARGAGARLDR